MSKLTLWFRPELKPVHVGVYGTKITAAWGAGVGGYSHWNGQRWGYQGVSLDRAAAPVFSEGSGEQNKSWRGLAKKP